MKFYKKIYHAIMASSVFRLDGTDIDLLFYLEGLGAALDKSDDDDEFKYDLGEGLEATLGDLVVGAYWALAPRRNGAHSKADRAFRALASIYTPNYCTGPEEGTSEEVARDLIVDHLNKLKGKSWKS